MSDQTRYSFPFLIRYRTEALGYLALGFFIYPALCIVYD